MNNNPNQTGGDVNLAVIGTGLGTSCGLGCLLVMGFGVLAWVVGFGVFASHATAVALLGFLAGLVVYAAVGAVTAYTAQANYAPVNLHIFIVGGMVILARLAVTMIRRQPTHLAHARTGGHFLVFISILLIIPMMLLGAALVKKNWNPPR